MKRKQRLLGISTFFLLAGSCLAGVSSGRAADASVSQAKSFAFALPPAPLARTLLRISAQTGTPIAFSPDQVAGRQVVAIGGQMTGMAAVGLALRGTALAVVATPSGGLKIVTTLPPAPSSTPHGGAIKATNAAVPAAPDRTDAASNVEAIVVTGSRLAHSALTDIMPTTTLDAEQLARRGYTNVGTALLRENPAYGAPDNSNMGAQGSYGAGQFFANMFNLGSQRTLTLVNGMRFVSDASSSIFGAVAGSPVDLSIIPSSLIKKVETVSVGGAPAYGSDAIAGVQNFILKNDFQGVEFTAQGGFSQKLDDGSAKIAFLAGRHFDHDRGGVVFDVEYNDQLPLTRAARPQFGGGDSNYFGQSNDPSSPYKYVLQHGQRYLEFTNSGIPVTSDTYPTLSGQNLGGVTNAAGQTLIFNPTGTALVPLTYNSVNGDQISGSGGNGFNIGNYNNLIVGQTRLNLTTLAHYDITDHLKAKFEGWYQDASAFNTSAQPNYNTALFASAMTGAADGTQSGNLVLSTGNPFLTQAERATIVSNLAAQGVPTDQFYLARANTDYGTGAFTTNTQTFRFVGGLNGDFEFAGRHFDWDITGTYGRSMSQTYQPMIVAQNFVNALNAVGLPDGSIGCAPGYVSSPLPTESATCAALNPFGVGTASQAAIDYVTAMSKTSQTNSQFDIVAEVKSTVVKLPAGDVRWDLGYEHRREATSFNPGAFFRGEPMPDGTYQQYGAFIPVSPVAGSYHTHEAFAELEVPLVSPKMHVPGVYEFSGDAAARYVNNSITGGFWTWTAGGTYAPTRDVVFHGNYTRSLRAPSITELFAPDGSVYGSGNDPCSPQFITSGPNPGVRHANCARAGVPSNFSSNINNYTVLGSSGGNRHLQNETADSFTGGVTLRPRWVRGLTINSDFIDINLHNEIQSLDITQIMDACYDSPNFPNAYCSAFTRDSSGQITNFHEGYYNIANQHVRGVQSKLDYFLTLDDIGLGPKSGAVEMTVNYMHYVFNNQTLLSQTYAQVGDTANPRDSFTTNINYFRGPLMLQWQMIYYGKSRYKLNVAPNTYSINDFKQYFTFNTTIGYTFLKHYVTNLNINNVFDAKPQYPYTGSTSRYFDGIIGRSFMLTVQANF
ncbi:TonB-dependent receptor domain-containing protein [Gluconacetobacter aggeris]|nr:TonB-dependent receptor [Gluconacetobacter aggeris]